MYRRSRGLSYGDALRLLGKYDHPSLDKADKNEATAYFSKTLTGLTGVLRREFIVAAHTIIAVTAVFDAFRKEIGPDYAAFEITDREKLRILVTERGGNKAVIVLPDLANVNVPAPTAVQGFRENLDDRLSHFFIAAIDLVTESIFRVVAPPSRVGDTRLAVIATSREKYTHSYQALAAAIPEFRIWALLGEDTEMRAAIAESDVKFGEELAAVRTDSLELFSRLLSPLSSGTTSPSPSYRRKIEDVAAAVLDKPLLQGSNEARSIDADFPTIERGFVAPGYRLAVYDEKVQPASEEWWDGHTKVRDDIDAFLAAHFAGPASTELPLLVLGNPGAGKSLLADVLAARLPADRFTAVNVQLRMVRAADRVREQIETALAELLDERVEWSTLADECDESTPVVLLDGFDELIQASGTHKSTYIQEVMDFQERQADRRRPVAVVITSRTLVADRARIPPGVPIVKLEEFDDGRVDRWLTAWNGANTATPGFSPLSRAQLDRHAELARQPLILLMLVIYTADPGNPPLDDENLSNADLYGRLIRSFVLRQVRDKGPVRLAGDLVEASAERSWWQLGIAALAMFNRGRQYVTDDELNHDLAIFAPTEELSQVGSLDTPVSEADRTLENFFFIHSPSLNAGKEKGRRTYEFLHATFGEYLVAEVALTLLKQMVAARAVPVVNPYQRTAPPDDTLLYALMSHPFTKRKTVLEFASGLFAALDEANRTGVLRVLDDLIRSFHDRARSDPYPAYDPAGATLVSRIAAYSANLVSLRVILGDVSVPVTHLFPHEEGELDGWRSTVRLWQSGLDAESWQSLVIALTLIHDESWCITRRKTVHGLDLIREAQLLGDASLEGALRAGMKFVEDDTTSAPEEQSLLEDLAGWIVATPGTAGSSCALPYDVGLLNAILDELDAGTGMSFAAKECMSLALSREAWRLPRDVVERALRRLMPQTPEYDTDIELFELIVTVCAHPDLISTGIIPKELLQSLLDKFPQEAMASLVLTWLTVTSDGDERVDDAFREFATQLGELARPDLDRADSSYLPIEVFDYLASPRTIDPQFSTKLLTALAHMSDEAKGAVEPATFLKVIGRFAAELPSADAQIALFIVDYLNNRGLDVSDLDLPSAMDMLQRLVDGRP